MAKVGASTVHRIKREIITKLFGFFFGQVMKVSGGKANPQLVNEILKKKL